ncbi:MAG: HYR domain-containing protein [Acidobacteriota bacterium]
MSARSLFALPLLLLIATVARADFVDGQLECSDGTPLANCLVTVVRTDTMAPPVSMNGITDASGVFRVRLPCTDADPALFIISSPCCSHDWSRTTTSCGADLGTLECTDCVSAPPHGCVDELSAGLDFSLAIDSLGQGWSWGKNDDGQLGIGIPGSFLTIPAPVSDAAGTGQLSDLVAISAGGTENASHALALDSSGHVWAWGHGAHGQLGDGTATASNLPVQVLTSSGAPLADIVAISAGGYHSLALDSSSQVWAWGRDVEGQLGQGTAGTIVDRAVQVNGPGGLPVLTDISAIAAGGRHSLALRTDGTVLAWGFNSSGQLGDCSVTQRELPTKVRDSGCGGSFVGNIAIAAGDEHSLVLDADLDAWSFGRNIVGQLGDGSGVAFSTAPVQVVDTALGDVHAISAGGRHSMALDSALEAWSWGSNASGVLGAGSGVASSNVPVPVVSGSLSPVALVDGGGFHSLALRSDDTAWGFGANGSGQLGDGSTTAASVPVAVLFPLGADPSDCGDCDDDFTPPEIDCPDVLTVNADAACNGTPPVLPVTDNCDPNPVLTFDPPVLSGAGPHVVTYTATDSNGNTSSCVVTIVVQDLKGPSLTCQVALGECPIIGGGGSTLRVGCGETVCFRARALDNCGGLELTNDLDPAGNATTPGILLTSDFSHVFATAGTHAVTWTATDTAGQSTSCTVYVTVTDEPPVMECGVATNIISTVGDDDDFANVDPGDAPTSGPGFVPCTGSNPTNGGVAPMDSLVQDSCRHWVHEYVLPSEEHCVAEARLTLDWRLLSTHPATCLPCPGAGNRPTETLRFYSAAGSLAFNRCFDPFAGALYGSCPPVTSGVTTLDLMDFPDVIDLLDGSPLTISITDDTAIDVATLELSFVATGSPIVVPVDDTACCATVTLGQCAVEDDCSDELTITNDYDPAQGGEVTDCFELGLHEVTFTATDSAGNNTSCTVELEVVDVTPPELVCPHPAEISVGADCTAFPPWPTAEDNCDPFPVITASPSILVGAGTHVVTYTATDDSGNSTSCTVTFEVLDSKAPSLTCGVKTGACDGTGPFSPTLTAECGEELCFSARAQDLCGPITLVNDLDAASGVSTPGTMIGSEFTHVFDSPGTYSVVWTATDGGRQQHHLHDLRHRRRHDGPGARLRRGRHHRERRRRRRRLRQRRSRRQLDERTRLPGLLRQLGPRPARLPGQQPLPDLGARVHVARRRLHDGGSTDARLATHRGPLRRLHGRLRSPDRVAPVLHRVRQPALRPLLRAVLRGPLR